MVSLVTGYSVQEVPGQEFEKILKRFKGFVFGIVRLNPNAGIWPKSYVNLSKKLYECKFKPDDVIVMSYPKSGTTWTQELVWSMKNNPNMDHPNSKTSINARSPTLEAEVYETIKNDDNSSDSLFLRIEEAESPRCIKTHLPFPFLNPDILNQTKVVYVARNPKDVVLSFHHYARIFKALDYVGNLDEFIQDYVDDELMFGPYWEHLKQAWKLRSHPNVHFIFYEDLKADITGELKKLNTFLGTQLTDAQLDKIYKNSNFSEMKVREARGLAGKGDLTIMMNQEVVDKDGGFLRQGLAGDWKNKLTQEQNDKIDAWTKKNTAGLDIEFKYSV